MLGIRGKNSKLVNTKKPLRLEEACNSLLKCLFYCLCKRATVTKMPSHFYGAKLQHFFQMHVVQVVILCCLLMLVYALILFFPKIGKTKDLS